MDIGDLAPAAAAYALYQKPGLLQKVAHWDGSETPGSKRAEAATDDAAEVKRAGDDASFDPFDQASWWKKPDAAPPASPPTDSPGAPKCGFQPFDQATWWQQQPKGTNIDAHA